MKRALNVSPITEMFNASSMHVLIKWQIFSACVVVHFTISKEILFIILVFISFFRFELAVHVQWIVLVSSAMLKKQCESTVLLYQFADIIVETHPLESHRYSNLRKNLRSPCLPKCVRHTFAQWLNSTILSKSSVLNYSCG